jgi:hypothetical protein
MRRKLAYRVPILRGSHFTDRLRNGEQRKEDKIRSPIFRFFCFKLSNLCRLYGAAGLIQSRDVSRDVRKRYCLTWRHGFGRDFMATRFSGLKPGRDDIRIMVHFYNFIFDSELALDKKNSKIFWPNHLNEYIMIYD